MTNQEIILKKILSPTAYCENSTYTFSMSRSNNKLPIGQNFVSVYGTAEDQHPSTIEEEENLQADGHINHGTRSILEVSFNIINATVGAGIIGLPYAIKECGFYFGIVVMTIVAIFTQLAYYMLVLAGSRAGIFKFASLAEFTLGRGGLYIANFAVFFQCFGSIVGYYIIIGDTIPVILGLYFPDLSLLASRNFIIVLISVVCLVPLCLPRSIGALARWSIFSVLLVPLIIFTIAIRAPTYAPDHHPKFAWFGESIFPAIGVMAFAFTSTQVAFMNYLSQRNQHMNAWFLTSSLSIGASFIVSLVFALIGYICFGEDVQPNIFVSFPQDDLIINLGRFALGVSMVLTIPMAFFPARAALQKMIGYESATRQPSKREHYFITAVLFAILLAVGLVVTNLGKVYEIVGGFSGTLIAYILPGLAYLIVFGLRLPFTTFTLIRPHKQREPSSEQDPLITRPETSQDQFGGRRSLLLDFVAVLLVIIGFWVMIVVIGSALRI